MFAPSWYLINHPGQFSLAIIIPWVDKRVLVMYDHHWGRKLWVLCNSRPCYQDCLHTERDSSWCRLSTETATWPTWGQMAYLNLSLACSKHKGDGLLCNRPQCLC